MKINVCDVCYYQDGKPIPEKDRKLVQSKYKISYKKGATKISLDVCGEHQNYFKECKTFDEANARVNVLYGIPIK